MIAITLIVPFSQCRHSGGILSCKPSNVIGLFNFLKWHCSIKASDVVKIMDTYPTLILQNRHDLLKKKFNLIEENKPSLTKTYMR